MQPSVSFVIPVRDDASRLQRCLAAIASNTAADSAEVVVIDNGSVDGSAETARRAGATVLSLPNVTVAQARNAGSAHARGGILAFVDADHLIDEKWIASAREILEDARVAGTGAPCSPPVNANWVQRAYDRFRPTLAGQEETDWLGSGNLVIRREVFEAVNGFDATLEACEDVDLCGRLRQAGFRLVADSRLRNIHLGDPSTLRALFFGELWRGRNNLTVTFRGPLHWRALPSVIIPVINLGCLTALVLTPWIGRWAALGALTLIGAFAVLRALRMTLRRSPAGVFTFVQNVVVALVYETARALALVFRATHRTRRELAGDRAVA